MKILEFMFQDGWHFFGMIILVGVLLSPFGSGFNFIKIEKK